MTLIEDLLDLQVPNSIKISPNCQHVLYSTTLPWGGKTGDHEASTIWLAHTGHEHSSRQLTSGLYRDHNPIFSPDGELIAFVSDRAERGKQWAIYVLPTNAGGEAYPLTPTDNERSIDRLEFSPDGKLIAYASADEKTAERKAKDKDKDDAQIWGQDWSQNQLRLIDVTSKQVTTLAWRDAHIVDLAWNNEGSKLVIAEVPNPDVNSQFTIGTTISIINVASKEVKKLCVFPSEVKKVMWAEDNTIHFIGRSDLNSTVSSTMVYSIDLSKESTQLTRFAHGEEDCAFEMGKAGRDVTLRVQHGMDDQIRMLGGPVVFSRDKEILAWDAAFTSDSDEMIIAVAQGDASSPTEVYTVTASGGAMVQLSNHGHHLKEQYFGTANILRCRSDDDEVELDAVYVTPSKGTGKPTKPFPSVVWPHGGPYARVNKTFNPSYFMLTTLLVHEGYGALFPNYRGGSSRGEKFANYALGGAGTVDYDDVITLTNHAITEGYADIDALLIAGWSQGGLLSYLAAVRNGMHEKGWKFKAAIPGAGVTDFDTLCMTSDAGVFEGNLAGKAPWDCSKGDTAGRKGSALWEFKEASEAGVVPPVLILHGEGDKRVPLEQAVGFRRALEGAGLPFKMVTYPREEHIIKERKHLVDMAESVLKFVDVHIGNGKT